MRLDAPMANTLEEKRPFGIADGTERCESLHAMRLAFGFGLSCEFALSVAAERVCPLDELWLPHRSWRPSTLRHLFSFQALHSTPLHPTASFSFPRFTTALTPQFGFVCIGVALRRCPPLHDKRQRQHNCAIQTLRTLETNT
uniref:Uncharacterized protein n=1 Tax=Craspedostauros australis TaxID=1486917 RepID=A0A7R9ZLI2_9STRA|mmetsp:Transcript_18677/g.51939  ORF Transcript_18677/g.51939 Transcript_18677/m.51939 type:complete len:142 (+) Transcript_18677:70-495(+)